MTKRLIINDANVLIDIEKAELVELIFELDYEFAVPDLLYEEEIAPYSSDFKETALSAIEFDDDAKELLLQMQEKYKKSAMSRNDISALVLAIRNKCILLTGEKELRQTAKQEGVEVHGILWLIEEMFINKLITINDIELAYKKMEQAGSRLPWEEVDKQIEQVKKNLMN